MWKIAFAGAVALVMAGPSPVAAETPRIHAAFVDGQRLQSGPVMTQGHIARFKAALKLRPEQERHWPAVANVLRHIVRQQASIDPEAGLMRRLSHRAVAMTADVIGLRQLAAAAMPLVRSMDDQQKLTAMQLVNAMGFGAVMAAF